MKIFFALIISAITLQSNVYAAETLPSHNKEVINFGFFAQSVDGKTHPITISEIDTVQSLCLQLQEAFQKEIKAIMCSVSRLTIHLPSPGLENAQCEVRYSSNFKPSYLTPTDVNLIQVLGFESLPDLRKDAKNATLFRVFLIP